MRSSLRFLQLARQSWLLFFANVVKIFELPEDIVSDRDPRFTGQFWIALFNMMGSNLKFSMGHHPQTDGQMKGLMHYLKTT
jgi:hypothetical protein